VLHLLEMLESLPCDFRFLWFAQESGDLAAMQERWGERLVAVPIQCPERSPRGWHRVRNSLAWRLRGERDHPLPVDAFRHAPLAEAIQRAARDFRPTVVLVAYVFWSWVLELFTAGVRKLIDTHDIMGDRHKRFEQAGVKPEWIFTTCREERRGLRRADTVIAIQKEEAAYFRGLTGKPVVTVGHAAPPHPLPEPAGPPTLLFVGSYNGINRDAAAWMLRECWPLIHRANPAARFRIAGQVCAALQDVPTGVDLLNAFDDLSSAYTDAHVAVCPLRFGSGLKIKCIEAMSFGRPLVTTTVGAAGLESGAGSALLLADTPEAFADACIRLLAGPEERLRLRNGALAFLADWNERSRHAFRDAVLGDVAAGEARGE
jgi:glycosyltransferase involved in cell wall biosynthesis